MSYEVNKINVGVYPAGAANLGRNTAVRLVAGVLQKPTAAGQCFGVVQADSNLVGEAVAVAVSGIVKIVCSGTIAVDALVTVDVDGKASAAAGAGEFILGKAIEAGVAGQVIACQLILNTKA